MLVLRASLATGTRRTARNWLGPAAGVIVAVPSATLVTAALFFTERQADALDGLAFEQHAQGLARVGVSASSATISNCGPSGCLAIMPH